jgi:hypothetical protein
MHAFLAVVAGGAQPAAWLLLLLLVPALFDICGRQIFTGASPGFAVVVAAVRM